MKMSTPETRATNVPDPNAPADAPLADAAPPAPEPPEAPVPPPADAPAAAADAPPPPAPPSHTPPPITERGPLASRKGWAGYSTH
jgi:hypothetical protein